MKKSQKIILAIITVLWVCAIGVEALRYVDEGAFAFQSETTTVNGENEEETSNEKQTEEATQETTETTTETTQKPTETTTQPTTQATTEGTTAQPEPTTVKELDSKPSTWSKKTVIKKLCAAVNRLENEKGNFSVHETQNVEANILECSDEALLPALSSIAKSFVGETDMTYNFSNGITVDATGVSVTAADVLPPKGEIFSLRTNNVSFAKASKAGENILLTVKVDKERVDWSDVPENHSFAGGYIDFTKLTIDPASVSSAEVTYKKSVIKALINKNGELISISATMPYRVDCTGRLGKSFTAVVDGRVDREWKVTV